MWANTENEERCPIRVYKEYARRRPINISKPEHPFYIATTTVHSPSPNDTWFKRNPVGVDKLGPMLKRMTQHSGMNQNKHLSNHSARKYLVKKLSDNNIPPNQIMQISDQKNKAIINNYSHINSYKHRQISQILLSNSNNKRQLSCLNSNAPSLQHTASVITSDSKSDVHVSDGFQNIFNAPVYKGTPNINVHQVASYKETTFPQKRGV